MTISTTRAAPNAARPALRRPVHTRRLGTLLALSVVMIQAQAAVTTYTITEAIQFVPGTTTPTGVVRGPVAINRLGMLLGSAAFDTATGTIIPISALANGATLTGAFGLNTAGQISGTSQSLGFVPVIRNPDASVTVLPLLSGHVSGSARAINDLGFSAGMSLDPAGVGICAQQAVMWDPAGNVKPLGSLSVPPYAWSAVGGMNNLGQVVGQAGFGVTGCNLNFTAHAFVSTPTGLKDLHTAGLPSAAPGQGSMAYAINDVGIAVGHVPTGGAFPVQTSRAAVWDTVHDTYLLLGNPALNSSLRGINRSGTLVGFESTYAVVGDAAGGPLVDLNTLVPGKPVGWLLNKATAINDAGQIAVDGTDPVYGQIAFVLTPTAIAAAPTPAPSNLVATAISPTQIRLVWTDNASNETGQSIRRCGATGCNAPFVVAANVTSTIDTVPTGFTFTYTVRAQGPGGDSLPSNPASATTAAAPPPPPTPPAAPTGLTGSANAARQVTLRWSDNANNETGYNVYRCQGSGCSSFSLVGALGADATGFQDSALRRGTRYSYRVRAINGVGSSDFSNVVRVTTWP